MLALDDDLSPVVADAPGMAPSDSTLAIEPLFESDRASVVRELPRKPFAPDYGLERGGKPPCLPLPRRAAHASPGPTQAMPPATRPLHEPVREAIRLRHLNPRAEQSCRTSVLFYGAGLRLIECCKLRVKDVDFERNRITVRRGKGDMNRVVMLPAVINADATAHLVACAQHQRDLLDNAGWFELPGALPCNLPSAVREWSWRWVFPAARTYLERETGQRRCRHQRHEIVPHQQARRAEFAPAREVPHVPASLPTCLLESGSDIRTDQELLGHKDVATTMIFTHVLNRGPAGLQSPADRLLGDRP